MVTGTVRAGGACRTEVEEPVLQLRRQILKETCWAVVISGLWFQQTGEEKEGSISEGASRRQRGVVSRLD